MKVFVIAVFLAFTPACSWFSSPKEATIIVPPPKVTHATSQRNRVITREPGSLWSDESDWNVMYSPTQTRVPGDIVTLKVDPKFRARLESALKRPDEKKPEVKEEDKEKEAKKADEKAAVAPVPPPTPALGMNKNAPPPNPSLFKSPEALEVTILEALPRGSYRVAANHGLKVTEDAPFVYIEGVLREREIATDDTAQATALLDLKFEPIDSDKKVDSTVKQERR